MANLTINTVNVIIFIYAEEKELNMKIRCKQCQINFKNSFTFQQHDCVVKYEEMSMEELLRRYNDEKKDLDDKSKS
jgi:hypothetical protein